MMTWTIRAGLLLISLFAFHAPIAFAQVATIEVEGDIVVATGATLTIQATVELHMISPGAVLQLNDGARIDGDGFLVFPPGGANRIVLGDPAAAPPFASNTAFVRNLRIDGDGVAVTVLDQSAADSVVSHLIIDNILDVDSGSLDMDDNSLSIVGPTAQDGRVRVADGASITGTGTFFIAIDPAALGGPPNTRAGAFPITGDGALRIAFDKTTDAGVRIDLPELGTGGFSFNRAGALYVTRATTLVGSFRNEGAARTEFTRLEVITTNLEVAASGEVFQIGRAHV